jgi:iron complex outermembrane receptor protein
VTGRLGLLYRINEAVAPFASFSQSFAPSGTKVSGNTGELLDATTGEQVELGAKFRLPWGGVSGTATAYRIDRQDVPIQDPNDRTRFVNGGEQRSEGFELDLAGSPLPSVDVLASLGFTDARWVESTQVDPGTALRGVPESTASLTTRWRIPSGPLQGLRVNGTVFSADSRPGDDQDSFRLDGFTTLSLGVARDWQVGGQQLSARLTVKNVTDERYFVASNGKSSVVPGAPRTIRAAIDWRF